MVQGVPPAGRRSQLLRVHGEIKGVLKGHGREPTRDALGDSGAMNDSCAFFLPVLFDSPRRRRLTLGVPNSPGMETRAVLWMEEDNSDSGRPAVWQWCALRSVKCSSVGNEQKSFFQEENSTERQQRGEDREQGAG